MQAVPENVPEIAQEDRPCDPSNLEDSATTTARHKVLLALHTRLAEIYPQDFHFKGTNSEFWDSASKAPLPELRVDPDLQGTWLRPPPGPDDEFGYWKTSEKIKLPPSKTSLTPAGSERKQLQRPKFFHVPDVNLHELLKAPVREKVFLPPNLFDKSSVPIKSSPHCLLDAHIRTSLLENFTTEAYLRILVDLTNCAAGTSSTVTSSEAVSLLPEVTRQAAQANARQQQSSSAAYVGNTLALRDSVLASFKVPPRTVEYLRGGDFACSSLFAPVPESFNSLLDSAHGYEFRCTSKSPEERTGSYGTPSAATSANYRKRPASGRGYPHPKRTPPPASKPPKGRGKPFPKGSAGRRSKPGRS